nr:hypothetical protein [Clostridioides sp.]
MDKSCDNCYWRDCKEECFKKLEPKNKCEEHNYECSYCNSKAEYISDDEFYCTGCLIQSFSLEESTETHYSLDGTYLGSDDDMDEVINGIKSCGYSIEELED